MSRRTFPRCVVAGLLAATFSPPALAQQPPNPWRGSTEVAPTPRPVGPRSTQFAVTVTGPGSCDLFSETVVAVQERGAKATPTWSQKPTGTFYRELPGVTAALTFKDDEVKAVVSVNVDGTKSTITITANCAVTKDGQVHGVITAADVDFGKVPDDITEFGTISAEIQKLVDQPFVFRARSSDDGVMIGGFRVAGQELDPQTFSPFCGKYKPSRNGELPVVKEFKKACIAGRCDAMTVAVPVTGVPAPTCLPATGTAVPGFNFSTTAPVMSGVREVHVQAVAPPGVSFVPSNTRIAPPPDVSDTMLRTLNQMMNEQPANLKVTPRVVRTHISEPLPPLVMPAPAPAMPVQGIAYPTPAVVPSMPMMVQPVRPAAAHVGTWHRMVGPMAYSIVMKDTHITITAKMAVDADGSSFTQGIVLTGDYHISRDGSNIVGLITSVDAIFEGELPDGADPEEIPEVVAMWQKAMSDKPFALSLRMYDGVLVIGNVRFPKCDEEDEISILLTAMGGRYTAAGDKAMPKPKAVKAAPNVRIEPLLKQSEDLRNLGQEWRRFWFSEAAPCTLTPVTPPPVPPQSMQTGDKRFDPPINSGAYLPVPTASGCPNFYFGVSSWSMTSSPPIVSTPSPILPDTKPIGNLYERIFLLVPVDPDKIREDKIRDMHQRILSYSQNP